MEQIHKLKLKGGLGLDDGDRREMQVLNRILRVTDRGLLCGPDPLQAELMIKAFGYENANPRLTPRRERANPSAGRRGGYS